MAATKTAISLEDTLLARIDRVARELELPRSRVLAQAAEEFLSRHENAALLARLNEAYADESTEEEKEGLRIMRAKHARVAEKW